MEWFVANADSISYLISTLIGAVAGIFGKSKYDNRKKK